MLQAKGSRSLDPYAKQRGSEMDEGSDYEDNNDGNRKSNKGDDAVNMFKEKEHQLDLPFE